MTWLPGHAFKVTLIAAEGLNHPKGLSRPSGTEGGGGGGGNRKVKRFRPSPERKGGR